MKKIFVVNPGSTSTKIALFEDDCAVFSKTIKHDAAVLANFSEISDELPYRMDTIAHELEVAHISLQNTTAFVGRGGGLAPLRGGTYPINALLLEHARTGFAVKHPAMLGAQIADALSKRYGGGAYVVNPPDVDELQEVARITGWAGVYRESRIHALNQKEVAIRYAHSVGCSYHELNLIIVHAGGGISVTAHRNGQMVDSNDIVNGDGPMAPTRCGSIPVKNVVEMCFSGDYTYKQMRELINKGGGLVHHLGTSDGLEIGKRIAAGDKKAQLIYDAMIYQISKYIGSMAAVLCGKVDAIILTGGMANDHYLTAQLQSYISFIAPVQVMPGEFEMEALSAGVIRVLDGLEQPVEYTGQPVWQGLA
ncbi:MAG: butyrate kinase [Angelakisella sp.]